MFGYIFLLSTASFAAFNIKSIFSFLFNPRNSFLRLKEKISFLREIYKNASWKTILDFCLFHIRIKVSSHLETGLLTNQPKTYFLVYYDGCSRYKICFPKKRGPCPFSQVFNEEKDVTKEIREFAGPSHNFHGITTTPLMLGFNSLKFLYKKGHERTFSEDERIEVD